MNALRTYKFSEDMLCAYGFSSVLAMFFEDETRCGAHTRSPRVRAGTEPV